MSTRLMRRIHLYLALLLAPWIVMYALSAIAMNHRSHFRAQHEAPGPNWVKDSEKDYAASFPAAATAEEKAARVLADVGLSGAHTVRSTPAGVLTIVRHDPFQPRRIRLDEPNNRLSIEREPFRWPGLLERLHSRRDYQRNSLPDTLWAVAVDAFIVAMMGWVVSGLWMWWKLRVTRVWSAVLAATGAVLFAVFLGSM